MTVEDYDYMYSGCGAGGGQPRVCGYTAQSAPGPHFEKTAGSVWRVPF